MKMIWVLGLGASLGYLVFKHREMQGRLDLAVRQWDNAGAEPADDVGAQVSEIKRAWRDTSDTQNLDFHERLPTKERNALLAQQTAARSAVDQYEGSSIEIQGVYLE